MFNSDDISLPFIDPTVKGQILDTGVVSFSFPPQMIFGFGSLNRIGFLSLFLKTKNAFIVSDSEIVKLGLVEKIQKYLSLSGIKSVSFTEVEPNPTEETIIKATELYKQSDCDVVIAVGGGSVIDTGKMVRLLSKQGGRVSDYDASKSSIMAIHEILPHQISIPTTSGTGSEVSVVSMVSTSEGKVTILGYPLISTIALIDPELTMSCPPKLTAYTGMDALTHAIEAFLSIRVNPVADMFSMQAITLIHQNLRKAFTDGKDIKARINMSLASLIAGMAFNQKSVGLVHACSHQLSSKANLPHGLGNAIMLPHVLKFNKIVSSDKYATMGAAIGLDFSNLEKCSEQFIKEIESLNKDLKIPKKLHECGVKEEDIPEMAKHALSDISILTNPLQVITAEMVEALFREAF